ncbi:MAG: MAPEG family protein [Rhizobiales bacterium]|nr:MAPEG family protein [Hyphomicrobiales bacterium]
MSAATAFAPVFVMVALTFVLLFSAGIARARALRAGEVREKDIALREPNWPERPTQLINAYQNQLELPVLYYLVVVAAFFSANMTGPMLALSWAFVVARLAHAAVHVTSNRLRLRFMTFVAGLVILMAMWALFLLQLLLAPA